MRRKRERLDCLRLMHNRHSCLRRHRERYGLQLEDFPGRSDLCLNFFLYRHVFSKFFGDWDLHFSFDFFVFDDFLLDRDVFSEGLSLEVGEVIR